MSLEGQSSRAVCGAARGSLEPWQHWQMQVWLQALSGARELGSGFHPAPQGAWKGCPKLSLPTSSQDVTPCNVWHNSSRVQCWFSSVTLCTLCMSLDVSLVLQLSAALPPVTLVFVKCPCGSPLPIAGMLWK